MEKAVLVMCEIIKEAEKPVEISFRKKEGVMGEMETKFVGPSSSIFAGLCELVSDGLKVSHPDDRETQKKVLDLLYGSVMEELELVGKKKAYGPINPDDVDF